MHFRKVYFPSLLITLASCTPAAPPFSQSNNQVQPQAISKIQTFRTLSQSERNAIARKIWQNESGGTIKGLTAWNQGENFPSLGIGHFIWYPKGQRGHFTESFPQFIHFATQRGAKPPAVALNQSCPWPNRSYFQNNFNNPEISGLRQWLSKTTTLQADFIIAKSRGALSKILAAARPEDRSRIAQNYNKVATTSNGTYALIDYVNFKGEGINPQERYKGQGWGLLQVLANMKNVSSGQQAAQEFAASAKRTLGQRVRNSPPARNEAKWLIGWNNRCNTYAQNLR